jgi:hypothetical protein
MPGLTGETKEKMRNFYVFTGEGDSLMVTIDIRNDNVMLSLGDFEVEIDVESAFEFADLLIDAAGEVDTDHGN